LRLLKRGIELHLCKLVAEKFRMVEESSAGWRKILWF
jgi:hypothetical protein